MSVLSKAIDLFRITTYASKSKDIEIENLNKYSTIDVPTEYLDIIKEKTEIEILVDKKKYLRIWGANGCVEMNDAYYIQKYIPKSLAIGDDGCCNVVLYASGNYGFGLYIVPLNDLGIDEMIFVADSLMVFFENGEGVDVFNNVW